MLNAAKIPNIFDLIYPVNAIYLTVGGEDPNVLFGGTWEKLAGGYALTTTNNTNGGDASTANAINHMPGQAFQGGLPDHRHYVCRRDACDEYAYNHPNDLAYKLVDSTASSGYNLRCIRSEADCMGTSNAQQDRYGMYQSTRVSVVADHIAVVAWKRTAVGGS